MTAKLVSILLCLLAAFVDATFAQSPTTTPTTTASSNLNQSRTPHRKPAPSTIEKMTTTELGNFDYDEEKGGTIPPDVTALDGTTIRLLGYMIPMDQSDKITAFALVDDYFVSGELRGSPPIQQVVVVNMPKAKAVKYFPDMITVEGKLHVRVKRDQGDVVSVFDLDATSVQPSASVDLRAPSSQPKQHA
jgi:hypothetical protein